MKSWLVVSCLCAMFLVLPGAAQNSESYRGLSADLNLSNKLPGPQHLKDYVVDGKLQLTLHDAIVLTLENNSMVQIQESGVESNRFSLLGAHSPFDPRLQSFFDVNRASFQSSNELQGVGTGAGLVANTLTQTAQVSYSQAFHTGTKITALVGTSKTSNNSAFFFFNPYFSSSLNFQFTQPLLRNRGRFPNLAPLIIARRTLQQSRANFKVLVSDVILQVVSQYWAVVEAHGDVEVQRKSLEAADVSYQRDKRALQLGALPPLDIYRSESEVASRRVQMIQAEYATKRADDTLRLTLGAYQDPYFSALDLNLTELPENEQAAPTVDVATALQQALRQRPELEAAGYALENDETGIRLAHNQLQPDLSLTGFYRSSGLGGNEFSLTTGELLSRGGLGSSFGQVFGFGFPAYGATLSLDLPVRDSAAQSALGAALVSRHRDLYSSRQIREQVTLDINNAVHQLEEANLSLAAGKTALDLARKTLSAEQRKYELGAVTVFFVLDAQNKLALAESDLLLAQVNQRIALARLDHATGNILQPYNVQIAELVH